MNIISQQLVCFIQVAQQKIYQTASNLSFEAPVRRSQQGGHRTHFPTESDGPAFLTSSSRFSLTRQATFSLRLPFSQSSPYLDVSSVCQGCKVNIASRHNELKRRVILNTNHATTDQVTTYMYIVGAKTFYSCQPSLDSDGAPNQDF